MVIFEKIEKNMELLIAEKWTYQDMVENLPPESRYEIINNELYEMPAPNTEHQRISRKVEFQLLSFVEKNQLGEVFDAPFDVVFDEDNTTQPDILFISNENLKNLNDKNFRGSPDLIVEIVSPSSVYRDQVAKGNLYAQHGVLEYWIIDPANQVVEILVLENGQYFLKDYLAENGTVKSQILQGFELKGENIFTKK